MTSHRYHDLGVTLGEQAVKSVPDPAVLERLEETITYSLSKSHPTIDKVPAHDKEISVIAGGPNLKDAFFDYEHKELLCVNQSHDWLIEQGIVPDSCAFMDNHPKMVDIIKEPHKDVTYYCASVVSSELLDKLDGYNVIMWHALQGYGEEDFMPPNTKLIDGGNTIGQRAISIARFLGYRNIQCFGLCGGVLDGENYAYQDQAFEQEKIGTPIYKLNWNGKSFLGTLEHANQAGSFWKIVNHYEDCEITVHGRGLIPEMARQYWNERREYNLRKNKS